MSEIARVAFANADLRRILARHALRLLDGDAAEDVALITLVDAEPGGVVKRVDEDEIWELGVLSVDCGEGRPNVQVGSVPRIGGKSFLNRVPSYFGTELKTQGKSHPRQFRRSPAGLFPASREPALSTAALHSAKRASPRRKADPPILDRWQNLGTPVR